MIVLAIVFAPILEAIEAVCRVPIIGKALCAIVGAILALVGALIGGFLGGLVGDAVDALNDPRDGVIEGDPTPDDGDALIATGIHVTDLDHGHNELHPLKSLRPLTGSIKDDVRSAGVHRKEAALGQGLIMYAPE